MEYKYWTDNETKYLKENFKTKHLREIAKDLGRTYGSITNRFKKLKLYYIKNQMPKRPFPKISNEEWAYIAGIVDGEGTISFKRNRKTGTVRKSKESGISPLVTISTTSPILAEYFMGLNQKSYCTKTRPKHCLPVYATRIGSLADIREFLKQILPYLKIKFDDASNTLEFCNSRLSKSFRSPYSNEEKKLVDDVLESHMKGPSNVLRKEVKNA